MVLFSLFGHENTWRNGQIRKTKGQFSEKIRTKWTGFIPRRTGLILQRTGLIYARIKPVRWRIKPVRQGIKPVHMVLIYIYIFFFIFLISQVFAFCQREYYHQNQHKKLLILISYVDLLNYSVKTKYSNLHNFRLPHLKFQSLKKF